MAFFKFALLFSCATLALAGQHFVQHSGHQSGGQCYAAGTTVTTKTTTTVSGADGDSGESRFLGSQERNLIRSSWKKAMRDGDVAPKILYRFIQAHPEYQKKFSLFADVPMSDLMKNGNFLGQSYTILAGLNEVVEAMGSKTNMAKEVRHLGWTHFNRGVTTAMFEQMAHIIVEVLEEELGSRFDSDTKDAWEDGLKALIGGISKSLKKEEDIAHPQTGLTPHQIADVRRTWEGVRGQRNEMVSTIFVKFFKESPSALNKFSTFGSVAVSDLPSNAAFNAQVKLVADRLDSMIASMDNTLQILGQIEYMGHSHKPRGVGRQEFARFGRLFMDSLAGKGVSGEDLDSWKGALAVINDAISDVQV